MDELFAEFMMEKEYVCGLAKVTLKGYRVSRRTFKRLVKEPEINKATFPSFVDDIYRSTIPVTTPRPERTACT
ncbi:MAG: hypothetical protein WBV94_11095 [Blastocatellia bacterium]